MPSSIKKKGDNIPPWCRRPSQGGLGLKGGGERSRESYLRVERPEGRFALQIALPSSVDAQGVRATHRNGVIEIALPKRQPAVPSQIRISSK